MMKKVMILGLMALVGQLVFGMEPEAPAAPRGKGRPKGSKNQPRVAGQQAVPVVLKPAVPSKKLIERIPAPKPAEKCASKKVPAVTDPAIPAAEKKTRESTEGQYLYSLVSRQDSSGKTVVERFYNPEHDKSIKNDSSESESHDELSSIFSSELPQEDSNQSDDDVFSEMAALSISKKKSSAADPECPSKKENKASQVVLAAAAASIKKQKEKAVVSEYPKVYFSPATDLMSVVYHLIQKEQKGIYGACYSLDDEFKNALIARKNAFKQLSGALVVNNDGGRNAKVRVIRDLLRKAEIPVFLSGKRYPSLLYEDMHHKFLLFMDVEGKPLLLHGSKNFSSQNTLEPDGTWIAGNKSRNNIIIYDDPAVINKFLARFLELAKTVSNEENHVKAYQESFKRECAKLQPIVVPRRHIAQADAYFSPNIHFSPNQSLRKELSISPESIVLKLIHDEQQGVKGALFTFNWYDAAQSLIDKKEKQKVAVSFVVDKRYAVKQNGSEDCTALMLLKSKGIPVRYYPLPGQMHNKFMIFENNGDGKSIIMSGSSNGTGQATVNWEDVTISSHPAIVDRFTSEFKAIYEQSRSVDVFPNHVSVSNRVKQLNGVTL